MCAEGAERGDDLSTETLLNDMQDIEKKLRDDEDEKIAQFLCLQAMADAWDKVLLALIVAVATFYVAFGHNGTIRVVTIAKTTLYGAIVFAGGRLLGVIFAWTLVKRAKTEAESSSEWSLILSKAIEDLMMKKPVQAVTEQLETKENRQMSKVACTRSPGAIQDAIRCLQYHIARLAAPAPDRPTIETPNADIFQNPDESQVYGEEDLL